MESRSPLERSWTTRRAGFLAAPLTLLLGVQALPVYALNIILAFDSTQSVAPSFDPDASRMQGLFSYAANYYEGIIKDDHTLAILFNYVDDAGFIAGELPLATANGRITSTRITVGTVDNDPANLGQPMPWFIDPTPATDTEFSMTQTLWRDLDVIQRLDWYEETLPAPPTFEVGYTGVANAAGPAVDQIDMLGAILHEFGHALGLDVTGTIADTQSSDGDYDFAPGLVAGQTLAVETANVEGDDDANRGHLENTFALMTPAGPKGLRRRPSHTDLLAVAAGGAFTTLAMPRRERYGSGDWSDATCGRASSRRTRMTMPTCATAMTAAI